MNLIKNRFFSPYTLKILILCHVYGCFICMYVYGPCALSVLLITTTKVVPFTSLACF